MEPLLCFHNWIRTNNLHWFWVLDQLKISDSTETFVQKLDIATSLSNERVDVINILIYHLNNDFYSYIVVVIVMFHI